MIFKKLTVLEIKTSPQTWNQALITPIPKKGNKQQLKYRRPFTLLYVDYKILTKI